MPPDHRFPNINRQFDPFNTEHTAQLPTTDHDDVDWNDPEAILRAMGYNGIHQPMPKIATATEVKYEAKAFVAEVFRSWELLKSILERHESTI
jgi:hypothetical protein